MKIDLMGVLNNATFTLMFSLYVASFSASIWLKYYQYNPSIYYLNIIWYNIYAWNYQHCSIPISKRNSSAIINLYDAIEE